MTYDDALVHLAKMRKQAEDDARARETPAERSERERRDAYRQTNSDKLKTLLSGLSPTPIISEGKWSGRELKDIKYALTGLSYTNGMADPGKTEAIKQQPQRAAVVGLFNNAIMYSDRGDVKSAERAEKLAIRICSEGVPRQT